MGLAEDCWNLEEGRVTHRELIERDGLYEDDWEEEDEDEE